MHRFYIPQKNISGKRVEITDDVERHQMLNVLRLRVGNQFEIFSDDGIERVVEIILIGKRSFVAKIVKICRDATCRVPTTEIVLYLGLLKKDKFEWVLQKGTEIGVTRFVPLLTEHAVKQIKEIPSRWKKILKEATEQCGGTNIPKLEEPMRFKDAVASVGARHVAPLRSVDLFFHPTVEENFSQDILKEKHDEISIWIGPEGGFSENEIDLVKDTGFHIVSFGSRVLRAETAAIVIPAVVKFLS